MSSSGGNVTHTLEIVKEIQKEVKDLSTKIDKILEQIVEIKRQKAVTPTIICNGNQTDWSNLQPPWSHYRPEGEDWRIYPDAKDKSKSPMQISDKPSSEERQIQPSGKNPWFDPPSSYYR